MVPVQAGRKTLGYPSESDFRLTHNLEVVKAGSYYGRHQLVGWLCPWEIVSKVAAHLCNDNLHAALSNAAAVG